MYTPTFGLTHSIVQNIVSCELSLHEIMAFPLSASLQRTVINSAGTENILALAGLLSISINEETATDISLGRMLAQPGTPQRILSNYRSTRDFIFSMTRDPYFSLSPSLLLHLNKLLLTGVTESWEYGRFRSIADDVNPVHDTWAGKITAAQSAGSSSSHYTEPQRFFSDALSWFPERKYHIHRVLKIGCVLRELLHVYPFVSGNQITILALTDVLMEKTGLSMHGLFPVARFFLQFSDEIIVNNVYSLSSKSPSTKDTSDDQTGWLEVFSKGMATEMSTLKNEISRAVEKKMNIRKKKILDLNPRQQKLLRHLQYNPRVSRRKFVAMTGVSSMTAYRDLNDLVKRKLIQAYGGGRSSYYRLTGNSEEEHTVDHTKKRDVIKIITDDGLSYPTRRESDPTFSTSDQSDI